MPQPCISNTHFYMEYPLRASANFLRFLYGNTSLIQKILPIFIQNRITCHTQFSGVLLYGAEKLETDGYHRDAIKNKVYKMKSQKASGNWVIRGTSTKHLLKWRMGNLDLWDPRDAWYWWGCLGVSCPNSNSTNLAFRFLGCKKAGLSHDMLIISRVPMFHFGSLLVKL